MSIFIINKHIKRRNRQRKSAEEIADRISENIIEKSLILDQFTPWLITIDTKGYRVDLMKYLRSNGIESAQVHYRNDRYSVFKPFIDRVFPNMDAIENNYLVLPLHTKVSKDQVTRICKLVKTFYADI